MKKKKNKTESFDTMEKVHKKALKSALKKVHIPGIKDFNPKYQETLKKRQEDKFYNLALDDVLKYILDKNMWSGSYKFPSLDKISLEHYIETIRK